MIPSIDELRSKVTEYMPDVDPAPLEKAYRYSINAHAGQKRASGEEFFVHCYAVANILTELKLDMPTLAAALLHDVLEDTSITVDSLRHEFGDEITAMVAGVTKISSYHFPDAEIAQAENWRKMLFAVTKDIRVILIKLADRLHNMRTIGFLDSARQHRIAAESLNLYAPFAQRLGIYRWKSQLEDLSFAVLKPHDYRELHNQWEQRQESDQRNLELWRSAISGMLECSGIPYRLSTRPKSLYGIYKKMERQHKPFSEIQDLIGIRLVTDTVANCYALLDLVHSSFKQVPGTFTDYIIVPKMNMYQSLHTSIWNPDGLLAEIQIRTEEMHRWAEYGIAAHWRYKEKGGKTVQTSAPEDVDDKMDWLKQVLEWQQDLPDGKEFIAAFKVECTFDQIFVSTPKGAVVKLPLGATPVDFAYAVHSEIGNHSYGAKVGKRMVPLDYKLKSGETCDILTRKSAHPNKGWLLMAITARARSKIRKYLRDTGEKI